MAMRPIQRPLLIMALSLLALLSLLLAGPAEGSEPFRYLLRYPHLDLTFCDFYGTFTEWSKHYRNKGLGELLNRYIGSLKEREALADKKFDLSIACEVWYPTTSISQNKDYYFIRIGYGEDVTLNYLARIVRYFAHPEWSSWVPEEEQPDWNPNAALRRRLEAVLGSENPALPQESATVLDLGDLKVIYATDRLYYELSGKRLDMEPMSFPPVRIKDRYLLFSWPYAYVFDRNEMLLRKELDGFNRGDWFAVGYRKWVNLYGHPRVILSYSYEGNRFFEVDSRSVAYRPRWPRSFAILVW